MKRNYLFLIGLLMTSCPIFAQTAEEQAMITKISQLIKTDSTQAIELANDAAKGKNKKNIKLLVGIGNALVEADKPDDAVKFFNLAQDANNKSAEVMVLGGDISVAKGDAGQACQWYEQAIMSEPKNETAYFKFADIYKGHNAQLAVDKLKQLEALRPDLPSVSKKIAEVYYFSNDFKNATEKYATIDKSQMNEEDLTKYAMGLFMNHEFEKSLEIATYGLQKNPRSAAFNRLAMYDNTDMKKYDEATKAAQAFFNNSDKPDFSYLDYTYYGYALIGQKNYKEAIVNFKKALELDSTRIDVLNSLSDAYQNTEDYHNAIETYSKYLSKLDTKDVSADKVFQLGKLYYGYATDKKYADASYASQRNKALVDADSTFAKVAVLAQDSYLGNMWRARTNSQLDPESDKGLAKPFYEKTAEILLAKNDNARYASQLAECYSYLGYYFMNKKMDAESKSYWNKVLSVDPSNATAKKALSILK